MKHVGRDVTEGLRSQRHVEKNIWMVELLSNIPQQSGQDIVLSGPRTEPFSCWSVQPKTPSRLEHPTSPVEAQAGKESKKQVHKVCLHLVTSSTVTATKSSSKYADLFLQKRQKVSFQPHVPCVRSSHHLRSLATQPRWSHLT